MGRSDVLSNSGTSRVFFCIAKGVTNPKGIADALQIKPPPVIQQLRRLQRIGIISLGKKVGKEQNYEIDWEQFLSVFLENAVCERQKPHDVLIKPDEYAETDRVIKSLRNNRYFKQFVHFYLRNIAEDPVSIWPTLSEMMQNIERVLPHFKGILQGKQFADQEKQEFFDKMQQWYKRTTTVETWTELHIHDALQKTLNT